MSESKKFINLIPPTAVAWLLQYSGRIQGWVFFAQMICSEVQNGEFVLDFKVW